MVIDIIGISPAACQGYDRLAKRDTPVLADLYLQGKLHLDDLVSAAISLSEVNEGYEKLKDPQVNRVVITSAE